MTDVTKKNFTSVEVPVPGKAAPINQLTISTSFPAQNETVVVRPNADTYYTMGFLDLNKEPMVLTLPVTSDNFFCFPCWMLSQMYLRLQAPEQVLRKVVLF